MESPRNKFVCESEKDRLKLLMNKVVLLGIAPATTGSTPMFLRFRLAQLYWYHGMRA